MSILYDSHTCLDILCVSMCMYLCICAFIPKRKQEIPLLVQHIGTMDQYTHTQTLHARSLTHRHHYLQPAAR